MHKSGLSIGEAAEAAGVTRKAIRVYESKGLLEEPARTASGYRMFDAGDVQVLTFIRRARTMGLHLEDIAELLAVSREGQAPCDRLAPRLDQRIAEVDEAIFELEGLRRSLGAARERLRVGVDDGTDASICPVVEQVG
ncbi:DNA-binding transcriptional MerR regulator [Actinomycetospora cinnamomea]|uniref:DNA-binding transcriptional MerR regulator n=2 Tax=Actinomycetospora cinnamomea TaxID=663609 RepID=A0A2U1FA14_9PSEU|nr:DNA-binding transcriptional MerR regulator [Actinomycetospora cinnamomea]